MIVEQEANVTHRHEEWKEAAKAAKEAKEEWEAETHALTSLIRNRRDGRGKKLQGDLFSGIKDRTEADAWRDLPVSAGHFNAAMLREFEQQEITTLGDIAAWIDEDPGIGEAYPSLKEELDAAISRWRKSQQETLQAPTSAAAPDAFAELWREFPMTGMKEFGLTDGDVTKLAEGVVKRTGETFPIRTFGDLNRFVTPNAAMPDFVRGYGDIKGIGQAGVDRISEAETKFWAAWNNGLKEQFAKERGLTGATNAEAEPVAEAPAAPVAETEQVPEPAN